MKGHIIAKIILIIPMTLLFIIISNMDKTIPISQIQKEQSEILTRPHANKWDKMDRYLEQKSIDMYYFVSKQSSFDIVIISFLVSLLIVIFFDLTVGIGRSRTEERIDNRLERNKLL